MLVIVGKTLLAQMELSKSLRLFTRVLSERELIGRFCDHFHEFEIKKKLDNISIFNYFQEFETKRNDRILIA